MKGSSCHDGGSSNAPNISGILGRKIASQKYTYSRAMKTFAEQNDVWSEKNIDAFLQAPQSKVPGTKMAFKGLQNIADRQAIIRYLQTKNPTE